MPFRLYACHIRKYGQLYHSVYRDSICVHDVGVTLQCPRCSAAMLERDRWQTKYHSSRTCRNYLGPRPGGTACHIPAASRSVAQTCDTKTLGSGTRTSAITGQNNLVMKQKWQSRCSVLVCCRVLCSAKRMGGASRENTPCMETDVPQYSFDVQA